MTFLKENKGLEEREAQNEIRRMLNSIPTTELNNVYIEYIQSFDKVYYKPPGGDEYLTIKENLDFIYKRLGELENNV